jgi:hypothetical protein
VAGRRALARLIRPRAGATLRRLCIITALALIGAGAGLVAAQPQGSVTTTPGRPAITIRGHATGLYPGAAKRLRLRLHNRTPRNLIVTRVRANVLDPDGRCAPAALRTRPRRVRRLVPARSSAGLRYRIRMAPDAASVCQGKHFPLRFRARVRR